MVRYSKDTSVNFTWMRGAVRTIGKMRDAATKLGRARAQFNTAIKKKHVKKAALYARMCDSINKSNVVSWSSTPVVPRDGGEKDSRRSVKVSLDSRTVEFILWSTVVGKLKMGVNGPPTLTLNSGGYNTKLTKRCVETIAWYFLECFAKEHHDYAVNWIYPRDVYPESMDDEDDGWGALFNVVVDGIEYAESEPIPLPNLTSEWTLPEANDDAWERNRVVLAGTQQKGCVLSMLPRDLLPSVLKC